MISNSKRDGAEREGWSSLNGAHFDVVAALGAQDHEPAGASVSGTPALARRAAVGEAAEGSTNAHGRYGSAPRPTDQAPATEGFRISCAAASGSAVATPQRVARSRQGQLAAARSPRHGGASSDRSPTHRIPAHRPCRPGPLRPPRRRGRARPGFLTRQRGCGPRGRRVRARLVGTSPAPVRRRRAPRGGRSRPGSLIVHTHGAEGQT